MVMFGGTTARKAGSTVFTASLFLVGLFVLVNIGLFFVGSISSDELEKINQFTASLGFYMQFIRWGLYLALLFYWKPIITRIAHFRRWQQYVLERALASQKTVVILLFFIEIFVIQGLPAVLITIKQLT
ncbi:MAG: hypothetical protein GY935_03980 [Gammaproteobacteria bacterium]|nr:hypothetical protein [Gammaproteobacteria bacterium]